MRRAGFRRSSDLLVPAAALLIVVGILILCVALLPDDIEKDVREPVFAIAIQLLGIVILLIARWIRQFREWLGSPSHRKD